MGILKIENAISLEPLDLNENDLLFPWNSEHLWSFISKSISVAGLWDTG